MEKYFKSLGDFAKHLRNAATAEVLALESGLELSAKIIQAEAKKYVGNLQSELSPFEAWPELSDSTKADKERKGFVFNEDYNPLLRTGKLRDSIVFEVDVGKLEAIVGSKSPIAAFQEFGTEHIPPRPFIGRAAFALGDKIAQILGEFSVRGIAGGNVIADKVGRELGYHWDVKK